MDELIALIRDSHGPAARMPAFVQQTAVEFRRDLVGRSLSRRWVGQVYSFTVPDEPILRAQVEIVAGHRSPLWFIGRSVYGGYNTGRSLLFDEGAGFHVGEANRVFGAVVYRTLRVAMAGARPPIEGPAVT